MAARRRSTVVCDVGAIPAPDIATIGVLARLSLGALRDGIELRLRGASAELVDLIALAGLGDVLRVELEREPEDRKEPLRVEEEAELDDPPSV
jgi:anti-anti-sigma regulatory factor